MQNKETKYILGGGFASKSPDGGLSFYTEIVKGIPNPSKVLQFVDAIEESSRQSTLKKNQWLLKTLIPGYKFEFEVARPESLDQQLQTSDLIFLYGGSPEPLVETLRKVTSLKDKLRGKTVVGVSAGAYAISAYYVKVDKTGSITLDKGIGILPVKSVTHYRSTFYEERYPGIFSWDYVDRLLNETEINRPTIKLREGEYKVIFHRQ